MEKKRCIVIIEETISHAFSVESESLDEAMSITAKKYESAEFVLDYPSLESTRAFVVSEDEKEIMTEWEEIV